MYLADIIVGVILDEDSLEQNKEWFKQSNCYSESCNIYSVCGLVGLKLDSMTLVDLPLNTRGCVRYRGILDYENRYFVYGRDGGKVYTLGDYGSPSLPSSILDAEGLVIKYNKSLKYDYLNSSILDLKVRHGLVLELNLLKLDMRIVKVNKVSGKKDYFCNNLDIEDIVENVPWLFNSNAGIHVYKDIAYIDSDSDTVIIPKECRTMLIKSKSISTFVLPEAVDEIYLIDGRNIIKHIAVSKNTSYESLCNILYGLLGDSIIEYQLLDRMNEFIENCEYKECIDYLRDSIVFKEAMKDIEVTVY